MITRTPKTVDAYIAGAPKEARAKLVELRRAIKVAAPKAEEKIGYGMPYYGYGGRLAYFAYAKHHIGLYIPPPVIAEHAKELKAYKTAMATVQLPLGQKLPLGLIRKLIKARVKKNEAKAGKKSGVCSRGHAFQRAKSRPVCPKCWPGYYAKKPKARARK